MKSAKAVPSEGALIVDDLVRVKALFQARTLAMHLGAPMPKPEDFRRAQTKGEE